MGCVLAMRMSRSLVSSGREPCTADTLPVCPTKPHALQLDAAALYDLARTELLRLGLLQAHFTTTKKGEIPEFDTGTDMMKASRKRLTPHGRLLLTQIGLATLEEA